MGTLPLFTKVALVKTNEAEAHALMKTLLNHGADVNILDQVFVGLFVDLLGVMLCCFLSF